ncbi:MAG: peptidylprolyl isomerase [Hyphomicrobiaceae bacterium]
MKASTKPLAACLLAAALLAGPDALTAPARADDPVVARVNGADITMEDIRFAETEIGPELSGIPEPRRRRVVIEYLIENRLMAAAGAGEKLEGEGGFESRMAYYRQRALRDAYFDKAIRDAVTEAGAKAIYDEQIAKVPPQEEAHARHILVKTKEEALEVLELIRRGDDFADVAKEKSQDPGSGANGGDLGYFGRGQMVKPFDEAVFSMKPGDISEPVESQFGWHVIKLEDKRTRPAELRLGQGAHHGVAPPAQGPGGRPGPPRWRQDRDPRSDRHRRGARPLGGRRRWRRRGRPVGDAGRDGRRRLVPATAVQESIPPSMFCKAMRSDRP